MKPTLKTGKQSRRCKPMQRDILYLMKKNLRHNVDCTPPGEKFTQRLETWLKGFEFY